MFFTFKEVSAPTLMDRKNVPYRITETLGCIPVELFGIEITITCFILRWYS